MNKALTYVREFYAIVEVVKKLVRAYFVIRTDHKNLQEMLNQVIQTSEQ